MLSEVDCPPQSERNSPGIIYDRDVAQLDLIESFATSNVSEKAEAQKGEFRFFLETTSEEPNPKEGKRINGRVRLR